MRYLQTGRTCPQPEKASNNDPLVVELIWILLLVTWVVILFPLSIMPQAFILLLFMIQIVFSTPIQEVFDNATPYQGFDKYLILDTEVIYSGSLGIYEGRVFIEGNGAVLDLMNGGGIWIYATEDYPAHLEVEYLNVINGAYYGISYAGTSVGKIENCNFINNDFGLKFFDSSAVEVKNSNFVGCGTYGLGLYSLEPNIDISYCNFWENADGDLQENCPG